MCHGRLFEALFLGSPGGENWRLSTLWVCLRVPQSRWLGEQLCRANLPQCEASSVGRRGINGFGFCIFCFCFCVAMWSKPRYKRHNFCDWDRMAWAPELQPRPKWFQMIAISRQRAQTESAAYLYTKCYETIPILPQICHFMRLALLNWGAQKLCPFSNTFFHFRPRKGFLF